MVLLTLIATLAAGMIWQQWRSVQVEIAERRRTQTMWIMNGALDWANLILREDARATTSNGQPTSLRGVWATPLAESRLSTFLNTAAEGGDDANEAFLGGAITDAQAKYNLRNVAIDGKATPEEIALLARLLQAAGADASQAPSLASALVTAQLGTDATAPLQPTRLTDLEWLDVTRDVIEKLRPYATILPIPTRVNLNTASREILAIAIEGLDLAAAQRIVQAREQEPFKTIEAAQLLMPAGVQLRETEVTVTSDFFEVHGRIRVGNQLLEEVALVQRRGLEVTPIRRERANVILGVSR